MKRPTDACPGEGAGMAGHQSALCVQEKAETDRAKEILKNKKVRDGEARYGEI